MATAYERVRIARGAKRPTGMDYLQNVFHGFFELHGDRRYADDPAIVGGLAYLGATPVTVIAIEKGHTAKERIQRGFGAPQPEGYRKALRLMREAEKFHRPVVCFVDTSGAGCNVGAEERGQGEAIAECLTTMSALQTPVLSILIGEGGSGGALALAAGDRVWMLENAVYSVISPEGCATILWKDAAKAEQAAEELKLTADDALALGVVESVIPEAGLGEPEFYDALSQRLMREIDALTEMPIQELLSWIFSIILVFSLKDKSTTSGISSIWVATFSSAARAFFIFSITIRSCAACWSTRIMLSSVCEMINVL